jgi:hypothetical protein
VVIGFEIGLVAVRLDDDWFEVDVGPGVTISSASSECMIPSGISWHTAGLVSVEEDLLSILFDTITKLTALFQRDNGNVKPGDAACWLSDTELCPSTVKHVADIVKDHLSDDFYVQCS